MFLLTKVHCNLVHNAHFHGKSSIKWQTKLQQKQRTNIFCSYNEFLLFYLLCFTLHLYKAAIIPIMRNYDIECHPALLHAFCQATSYANKNQTQYLCTFYVSFYYKMKFGSMFYGVVSIVSTLQ